MVILASRSPQRETLLRQIGIEPIVIPAQVNEILDGDNLSASLQRLAERKAAAVLASINMNPPAGVSSAKGLWIVGADTVVVLDGSIYGKAGNKEEAWKMLECLSGNTHRVLTGIFAGRTVRAADGIHAFNERVTELADTAVTFKPMSSEEITWYVSTGEWQEAAGAYRIQGRGACLVSGISGSFSNVVGLPLDRIYGMLVRLGFVF